MTAQCSRPRGEGPRRFLPIAEALEGGAAEGPAADASAARLLALGVRPARRRERASGRRLDPSGRLGRVIWLHREGAREERAGRWGVADFYWSEAIAALGALVQDPGLARAATALADPTEADRLLRALVDEVFIDTHCGFYNGRVASPGVTTPQDRAFDHIRQVEAWIATGWTGMDGAARGDMLGPVWELRLELARQSKRWDDAAAALEQLRRLFPTRRDLEDRTVGLELQRAFEGLSNRKNDMSESADAAILKRAIDRIDDFRSSHPGNLQAFEALGHLHHVRAIKLANAGQASEAMVEAQRAIDHWPGLDGAEKSRDEIAKLVQAVIDRAAEIRATVARTPNATLNWEGHKLCAEADRGYKPLHAYRASAQPGQVAAALERARNRDIWSRAGLDEPADRFDERASAFVESLNAVVRRGPGDREGAASVWREAAAGSPDLVGIDEEKVGRFLADCLFGRGETTEAPAPDAPRDAAASEAPSLPSAPVGSRLGEAPFEFWLFGPRGRALKVFAAAAALLLLVGSALAISRFRRDRARDVAFDAAVAARANRDHLGVIRAAEVFLDHPPYRGSDPRDAQVRTLYDEAIVHWFIGRDVRDDVEAKRHVDAYRRLAARRS